MIGRALARTSFGCAVTLALAIPSCSLFYPEIAAPLRDAPEGRQWTPAPPSDVLYLEIERAVIPARTRDGRRWDALGGEAPDPFAKFFVNGVELFRTPVQANTRRPSWPNQPRANYRVPPGSEARLELWDANSLNDSPICYERIRHLHAFAERGSLELECDSGARVVLTVAPARAKLGLGFWYELRDDEVVVSRLLQYSPASRAGLRLGDRILRIQGRDVAAFKPGEAQSLINAHARTGLKVRVRHQDGKTEELSLKEGPIYPLIHEAVAP